LNVDEKFVGTFVQVLDAVVVVETRRVDDAFTERGR
jgi:hypothetical protein